MSIHNNLRQLRLNCKMTQEQVAKKLCITRQALSSYESGRTYPDIDMLLKLSDIYGTDLYGILYGKECLLKAIRQIKIISSIIFLLLTVLTLISSVFLWSINKFFPLAQGFVSDEEMVILNSRLWLNNAWQISNNLIMVISFLAFALLFTLLIIKKIIIPIRTKLICCAIFSAAILFISIIFGLIDPIYAVTQYITLPALVILRLALFLVADLIINLFQKRKVS